MPLDSSGRVSVRKEVIDNSLNVIRHCVSRLRHSVKDYRRLSIELEDSEQFNLLEVIEWLAEMVIEARTLVDEMSDCA